MPKRDKSADRQKQPTAFPTKTSRALPVALLRAREALMVHFRPVLSRHGVSEQQWRVLRMLAEAGPLDASQLAKSAFVLPSSLSRIIRTLESRGELRSVQQAEDRRRLMIEITEKGAKLIEDVVPESRKIYDRLEETYGKDFLEQLIDALRQLEKFPSHTGRKSEE